MGDGMKNYLLITVFIIMGLVFLPNAFAGDKSKCIYGSKIDQGISFYQARLYLIDSEYKILSDIGKDARKRIDYLYKNKQRLVKEMEKKEIGYKTASIIGYVNKNVRNGAVGLGYTTP
jgi:hypothetical protein